MKKGVGLGLLLGAVIGALLATPAGRQAVKKVFGIAKTKWGMANRVARRGETGRDEERRAA